MSASLLPFPEWKPLQHPSQKGMSLADRFSAFHRANPQAYAELLRRALKLRVHGFAHYSAKAPGEVIRYDANLTLGTADQWKLNNDYTSRYARLLMEHEPRLEGFFSTRELRKGSAA